MGPVPTDLTTALADVRTLLLDTPHLARAVAAGRRKGLEPPAAERVEVRPVQLKAGPHLQFTARTGPVVSTRNVPVARPPRPSTSCSPSPTATCTSRRRRRSCRSA